MPILSIWHYLQGYLEISVTGAEIERLLNLAVSRGLHFWDLRRFQSKAYLKILVSDFKALRALVRISRCKVRIERKVGLPFWVAKGRRRKGLIAGALLFCLFLYFFSSFIWFIKIEGLEQLSEEEVLALADELGVRPGVLKSSLDFRHLENQLVLKDARIAWVGFSLKGSLLQIEVVESINRAQTEESPADLIASKDGLVEEILVLNGEARVEPGEVVERGQVLIAGEIRPKSTDYFAGEELPVLEVRARGTVSARVWNEEVVEQPLEQVNKKETGNYSVAYYLVFSGRKEPIFLWGKEESPYLNYVKHIIKTSWGWRNLSLPVELLTIEYRELELEKKTLTHREAVILAREKALSLATENLSPAAKILSSKYEEIDSKKPGHVAVRVIVEILEDDITELHLRQPRIEQKEELPEN